MNNLSASKKILVIAYSFPPVGGGRVRRVIKFTKYLRDFGWQPVVLTVKKPVVPNYDYELIEQLSKEIKIIRTNSIEFPRLTRYFKEARRKKGDPYPCIIFKEWVVKIMEKLRWWILIPDSKIGWIPFAVIEGWQVINEEKRDVIFVSGEPFSSFLSAALLKLLTKKPLILDFRDEWSEFNKYYFPQKNALVCKINKILEYMVVRYADVVVSVTQRIVNNFRERYPSLKKDKFVCITNGFDPEDFKFISRDRSNEKFTITYVGSIYPQRTPYYFFEAIEDLLADVPEITSKIKIIFLGHIDHRTKNLFTQEGISNFIYTPGFLKHRTTLSYLINSDILLFLEDQIDISDRLLPAKLFVYIGAERPILALANDGSVKDLLERIGCGVVVPAKDIKAIKSALKMFYVQYQENRLKFTIDRREVKKFYRKNITERLARVLDQLVLKKVFKVS